MLYDAVHLYILHVFSLLTSILFTIQHRLRIESYPFPVNGGAAHIGGSHVQYVDYDRSAFASFMNSDSPASNMVIGMGEMVDKMVNLKGEPVGKRNGDSETTVGAHYGNTSKSCVYIICSMIS